MIRATCLIAAAALAGSGAMAQTVAVRSGEHENFTRLVMLLPDKAKWTIGESDQALRLSTDLETIQFDTSQVFSRIPRTRLVDLNQGNPGEDLVFSLGCACSISSFLEASGYLVIDIKDAPKRENVTPEPRRLASNTPANQQSYRFSSGEEPMHDPPSEAPEIPASEMPMDDAPREPDPMQLPLVIRPASVTPMAKPSPLPAENPRATRQGNRPAATLNISEERLLAQINRASDQGLLDLRVQPQAMARATTPKDMAEPTGSGHNTVQQARPLPVSLSAVTVVDRDLASVARSIDHTGMEMPCLKSKSVALDDWGGMQPFDAEIGHWRAQLFGERDRVNQESALGLARAYLHFGFGAEAEQAIELSLSSGKNARILKSLARVLEAEGPVGDGPFTGQQHCDGDVALWAVLAAHDVAQDVNDNAVQQAFLRLPLHLRSYLGPRLSQIFSESEDASMAKFILRAMARVDIEPGSGVELAKAAVAQLHGDTETEEQELMKSLATGSEHSPEALIRLIANIYETGDTVAPDLHDLAAAYALEYRNTDKGTELRRTNAIALALAGQFDGAFETLPDIEKRDGAANRQLALNPLLALLTKRADDVTFSRLAMISALRSASDVPSDTGNEIARRMLDLGFSDLAAPWVEPTENPATDTRRIIRAEIALKNQLPNRAMVELLGLSGPKAAKLRAQAMWQEGEYQQAGQMLAAVGEYDEAARGFWMAETWGEVPEQAVDRYAQIVAGSVDLRDSGAETTPLTPLAEARALMQGSSVARSGIAELLQSATVESAQKSGQSE